MEQSLISRRSFLQATSITGIAAAVAGPSGEGLVAQAHAAPARRKDETKIVKTSCRACIHNCGVLAHVRNGRVVKVEGNPEFPMSKGTLCAKGLAGVWALYNPNRNKYPLIRVGRRGENKWKRISWKEAIDIIAKKLMEARRKWGAESVLVSTGGGGNPAFRGVRRFANTFGTPNFFEPGCAQCFLPRTLAFGLMYGGPTTSIADEHAVNGIACKTGFRLLKERCEPWTLEKAGKTCWLEPKKIEQAIKIYVSGPGGISLGVATDQNQDSVEAAMGACILNALMGNVEKPGALMQRRPSSNVVPAGSLATACSFILPKGQLKKRLGGIEYKGLLQWDAAQIPAVLHAIKTGKPYQPHIWIERSGNKFAVLGNASSWEPAMKKLDFIVHMYMYPTSFSMYADMLLPATEWLETNMLVENLNMVFARQAVTHLWETCDETLFWGQLVKRLAELGHENCKKARDAAWMKAHGGKLDVPYWDSMEQLLDMNLSRIGLTWKKLLAHNPYTWMPFDKWNQYHVYSQKDPKTGKPKGFHTPSGKLELYGEVFINLGRTGAPYAKEKLPPASHDYDPLPQYHEPAESPLRPITKQYPLVMTNGRIPMYHHGTLRNVPFMREIYPVPEIWVHPDAAKKYGVKHGDWAYVESRRGKITARVRVTQGVNPGVVYMERFWNPENLHTATRGWKEMNVNCLSKNDPPFNAFVGTYTLRGYQVRISKAPGAPKGVWTRPEQFKAWLPKPSDPTKNVEF
ncbi:molybdopterin-dependent oxidoreductase [Mesosutterella sp. AGMB02718]|uniref:Molybdopterin-dependent oxidoreductase n=1 Tax=Mesosutterella faecium TaxID=2925194 RepID=A0ABT7IQD3_9BURK|nr:molybdopterin-dependent oxidoreductase [Mesosutterella sp. AGMB02718]MDL2060180.1 molybdopterin-dependent oxidoreductase [Mesosutterella sp. AGMB02718]